MSSVFLHITSFMSKIKYTESNILISIQIKYFFKNRVTRSSIQNKIGNRWTLPKTIISISPNAMRVKAMLPFLVYKIKPFFKPAFTTCLIKMHITHRQLTIETLDVAKTAASRLTIFSRERRFKERFNFINKKRQHCFYARDIGEDRN